MRHARLACIYLMTLVLSGCASYKLGPTNGLEAGSKSIEIRPFQNDTLEPRLIEPLDTALRRTIQQDGTYHLDTQGGGDIIVTGVLIDYNRSALSFQPRDTLTARDFYITVKAKIVATERSTGKKLVEKEVTGRTTLRAGLNFASAERQAVPLLASDLAYNITSLLVDGSW